MCGCIGYVEYNYWLRGEMDEILILRLKFTAQR